MSIGSDPVPNDGPDDGRLPADSVAGRDQRLAQGTERALGDFTLGPDSLRLLPLAVVIGALSAGVALVLLDLIGLFTHLAYYGRLGVGLVPPTLARFHYWTLLMPVAGGLLVGLMARFGSERIRGHGIPEAMETILVGGSRMQPRLAVLKPISSAISIGSGGPFGAEGPIILTGGAVGSVLAQFFHLSAIERRCLLVAGACGGMAAVFGTPVAAALFGVELLVFEWRPRSMVPIAVSVTVAEVIRNVFAGHGWLHSAPLFPVPAHGSFSGLSVAEAALIGLAAGALAWALTQAVYGAEDAFKRLPLHWMWWPAIGGLVVGLGGLIEPRALGVGYGTIGAELAGRLTLTTLAAVLLVKLVVWSVALGSGTSGGILAPLLIMGAALGALIGHLLGGGEAAWALMGMAGTLAGVTRSPFTSVVFAFELTHDTGSLLPLLIAASMAHLTSALVLRRSILTEKVARRGFHVMREYAVDPLEALFVREVMIPAPDPVPAEGGGHGVVAYSDETLRTVADRMATFHVGTLPVLERSGSSAPVGLVTTFELLAARRRQLEEERHRSVSLRLPRSWPATPTTQGPS